MISSQTGSTPFFFFFFLLLLLLLPIRSCSPRRRVRPHPPPLACRLAHVPLSMDYTPFSFLFFLLLLFFFLPLATISVLLLFGRHLRRRRYKLPSGQRAWPIIGNLNLIGPLPHRSIHALSQKHGLMPLLVRIQPRRRRLLCRTAREFLKTHDAVLAGRPKFSPSKYTTYNYSDITWSQYGPYWRQARKRCLTELFSAKRLESYEYIRREERKAVLKELYDSSNKTILFSLKTTSLI